MKMMMTSKSIREFQCYFIFHIFLFKFFYCYKHIIKIRIKLLKILRGSLNKTSKINKFINTTKSVQEYFHFQFL